MHKTNKDIQLNNIIVKYVIIVKKDGCWKYISKSYNFKYAFDYSIKMSKAKIFDTIEQAKEFIDNNNLYHKKPHICIMKTIYEVEFNPTR